MYFRLLCWEEMELECWSEDWGIPTVDPECLKILAFSKFSGAPVTPRRQALQAVSSHITDISSRNSSFVCWSFLLIDFTSSIAKSGI